MATSTTGLDEREIGHKAIDDAAKIDLQAEVPVFVSDPVPGALYAYTGIVDQDVDMPEPLQNLLRRFSHRLAIADIGFEPRKSTFISRRFKICVRIGEVIRPQIKYGYLSASGKKGTSYA